MDLNNPFQLDRFIDVLHPILTHFRINFAVDYIFRNEDVLTYFHPTIGNSCLLKTAFDISGEADLTRCKTEFGWGNWLELTSHLNLRPNTKSVVECLANITFYV